MDEQMTSRLYLRMPDALLEALHQEAKRRYSSASDVAREAISEYLKARAALPGNGNAHPAPADAQAA